MDISTFQNLYPQLFKFWHKLNLSEKKHLQQQLEGIDFSLLQHQQSMLKQVAPSSTGTFNPFTEYNVCGNDQDRRSGYEHLQKGEMGCLILAGGQGSRLRLEGPKGLYPITLIKHKTLFQLFAEKTKSASRQVGTSLPLAIMTSPQNDFATKDFFHSHRFFGLEKEQVSFFSQKEWPFLDSQGQLFLESPSKIAMGPSGNGFALLDFFSSGLWKEWVDRGVNYLNVIYIDNPLADPFDAELLGYHIRKNVEATFKCTEKRTADEKVGVIVKENGNYRVIEYSEMSDDEKKRRDHEHRLIHCCSYIGLFCVSMEFIHRLSKNVLDFPLHRAWKAAKFLDDEGNSQIPNHPNAWKFETYIFDFLMYTNKIAALLYPREFCFAPLKNFTGMDSSETVKLSLQQYDRLVLEKVTGLPAPNFPFELDTDFYYPTPTLLNQWKGRSIVSGYVVP